VLLLLLLSSARRVQAVASANQSLQSYFLQKEFFGELIVFRHLNMGFVIFFNVILSDLRLLHALQTYRMLNISTYARRSMN